MKNQFNKVFSIVLLLFLIMACEDFLDVSNPGAITADTFFETPGEVEQSVNTLYPLLGNSHQGQNNLVTQNSRADDSEFIADGWASFSRYYNFNYDPTLNLTNGPYSTFYTMIYRANTILENMVDANWSGQEESRNRLESEIYFFRGYAYFNLAFMYGQVPIVTEVPKDEDDFHPPRAESIEAVYDQAIADLQIAKNGLPIEQIQIGRITQGAATAYLGKTYLYRAGYLDDDSYYSLAANEFIDVIDLGIYSLVDNYQDNFTAVNENNEESILEAQFLDDPDVSLPTQGRPFNSVPGIAGEIFLRPSEFLLEQMRAELTIDGEYDIRLLETVYFSGGLPLFGVPYENLGDGISCIDGSSVGSGDGTTTTGRWWRKYLNVNLNCEMTQQAGSAENNERLMRYADVLLMYAESVLMSGGDPSLATSAVQEVRDRANLPVKNYANNDELMEEIRHQRLMEFAYENIRYFDLIRWGILEDALINAGFSSEAANYNPVRDKYFPIPPVEVNSNRNMSQSAPWQ